MTALLRALAASPDARVQTLRMTDNGDVREKLTVQEMARRHVSGVSEIVQTSDGAAEDCARKAGAELRLALKNP